MNFDQTRFENANLSWIVYQPESMKYTALRKYGLDQTYFLMPKFTDINNTTFYNWKTQQITLAIRGTDINNTLNMRTKDLQTDLKLALGQLQSTERYASSKSMLEKIRREFPQIPVILTGHSLGSAIADYLSMAYKLPAILFNTGSSPFSVVKNPLATRYTTNRPLAGYIDFLSVSDAMYNTDSIYTMKKPGRSIHTIENFTPRL
jgi:hypothetical protein